MMFLFDLMNLIGAWPKVFLFDLMQKERLTRESLYKEAFSSLPPNFLRICPLILKYLLDIIYPDNTHSKKVTNSCHLL